MLAGRSVSLNLIAGLALLICKGFSTVDFSIALSTIKLPSELRFRYFEAPVEPSYVNLIVN